MTMTEMRMTKVHRKFCRLRRKKMSVECILNVKIIRRLQVTNYNPFNNIQFLTTQTLQKFLRIDSVISINLYQLSFLCSVLKSKYLQKSLS